MGGIPHWRGGHARRLAAMSISFDKTLRTTPALAAGVTERLWEMNDIVDVFDCSSRSSCYRRFRARILQASD
jgi:hypothetical protein